MPVSQPTNVAMRLRAGLTEMAVQDWVTLVYHAVLVLAVVRGQRNSPDWLRSLVEMTGLFLVVLATQAAVRGRLFKSRLVEGVVYRVVVIGAIELSYFFMRRMLPVANPTALDDALYALDLSWFGFEPALTMQAWITPLSAEWFAFFYYGYFYLTATHVLSVLFFGKRRQPLGELTAGLVLVFCTGHILYMLVPGYGPGVAMANDFTTPLPDTPWVRVVMDVVQTGGAQKDIFPSIHTAFPTFLALWSFRHRWTTPYRYTWPIVTFFSANIIVATMYLRWHYLIDVVAGFTLGTVALWLAVPITRFELTRRQELGLRPVWPEFDWRPRE